MFHEQNISGKNSTTFLNFCSTKNEIFVGLFLKLSNIFNNQKVSPRKNDLRKMSFCSLFQVYEDKQTLEMPYI